jgi:transposase
MMLDNIDRIGAQIAALDARIADAIGPFSRQAAQLADIPGVDTVAAAELIAEIGVDMARFPTAAHLVSWAKFCPQTHQSAWPPTARVAVVDRFGGGHQGAFRSSGAGLARTRTRRP